MLSDFRAVLFDVDGTLVDSLTMIVVGLADTIERFTGKRPSDDEIRAIIGMPMRRQFRMYFPGEPSLQQIEEANTYALSRFDELAHTQRPFSAAIHALQLCHSAGLKTALVTSKSSEELTSFLHQFSGAPYLHATVCSSDVIHPKPDPESAFLACRRLNVQPDEAVMVGDSVYDLRCGRAAGLFCVAVAYGAASKEVLLAERPDLLLDTPEALLEWVRHAFPQTPCPERK